MTDQNTRGRNMDRPGTHRFSLKHFFPAILALFPASLQGAPAPMVLYHNDLSRTGLNSSETSLTTANVNSAAFGKLFTQTVDGQVYTQPLYVPGLTVNGTVHNVVFIATEHDSVYAFDADAAQAALWKVSFLNAAGGVTTVAQGDVGNCPQITTEIGITDTPAIDLVSGTIYVVAMTKQASGGVTQFFQQLHALDLATGAEKSGSPVTIQASVPGTGDGGTVDTFNPRSYKARTGILLYNGVVFTGWTSHCDYNTWGTYHGWVIGYNASNVQQQVGVFNTTPNGSEAAVWSGGDSPAVDQDGYLYFETGNGTFSANTGGPDYGDSLVKLAGAGTASLAVTDYFCPADQAALSSADQDLGSVGQMLLPDSAGSATHPHLVTGGDKTGEIFLLDRDNLGGYLKGAGATDDVVQEFNEVGGANPTNNNYTVPCYFNGRVYWSMVGRDIAAYGFTNGLYTTTPDSQTSETYAYPGCVPSLSSNGNTNGILWAIQPGNPAVLRAYDATNLATELYNSSQAAANRDSTGSANNKFTPPTIINGKVYVPTTASLVVYGLLPTATPTGTLTPPATSTSTAANTSSPTPTATFSPTATSTVSATPTKTETPSFTSTSTFSPTASETPTGTDSFTPTATATFSSSATGTPSATSTGTDTSFPTSTASFSPTDTLTPAATSTFSPTSTETNSFTPTPTATFSLTASSTASETPTGTDTFSPTPTVSLTPTVTLTSTAVPTDTSSLTPTPTPSATSTFSATSTGTDTFPPTETASLTPTITLTSTATYTASPTPTNSLTPTVTSTSTETSTGTSSLPPTLTPTSSSVTEPVLYPNPAPGESVNLLLPDYAGLRRVEVDIFTTAFRKVQVEDYSSIPSGTLVLELQDRWGSPLANGVYYLVVRIDGQRFIKKLIVAR